MWVSRSIISNTEQYCTLSPLILINFVLSGQRSDSMDLEGYNPNTEWSLESASVERWVIASSVSRSNPHCQLARHETEYECCPQPFVDITYTIRLQSKNNWILGWSPSSLIQSLNKLDSLVSVLWWLIFRSVLQLVTLIILILWAGQGLLVVVVAHYNLASNYIF